MEWEEDSFSPFFSIGSICFVFPSFCLVIVLKLNLTLSSHLVTPSPSRSSILAFFSLFSFCCYFCSNYHLLDALITSGHTVPSSRSSFLTFSSLFSFCCYFVHLLASSTLSSQLVGPFLHRGLPTKRQLVFLYSFIFANTL